MTKINDMLIPGKYEKEGRLGILGEPVRIGLATNTNLYAYNYVTTYGTCVKKCKKNNHCKTNKCDKGCINKCRK